MRDHRRWVGRRPRAFAGMPRIEQKFLGEMLSFKHPPRSSERGRKPPKGGFAHCRRVQQETMPTDAAGNVVHKLPG